MGEIIAVGGPFSVPEKSVTCPVNDEPLYPSFCLVR